MFYIYEIYDSLNKMYYIGQRDCKNIKPENDKYMGSSLLMHEGGWFLNRFFDPIFENPDCDKYLTKKILYNAGGPGAANVLEILTIEDYRKKFGRENIYNISDGGHGRGYLGDLVCEKISKSMKNYYNSMSQEEKIKYREWRKTLYNDAARLKMSNSAKARGTPQCAFRNKKGENNPMFNKHHSDKSKNQEKRTKKMKTQLLEIYGAKGRKWYNNPLTGETKYFSKLEKIPLNWVLGRGKIKRTKTKKMGKNLRKQIKCIETTEAWLSLTDFAREKEISISYASQILKKGIYKDLHYKYII
jgi:hypothetical protein